MSATLVTGAAGFIGFHVCRALLARGEEVIGLDELNDYYPVVLKHARLRELGKFRFLRRSVGDIQDDLPEVSRVIHLAAWAGVRNSTRDPVTYGEANVMGMIRLLEEIVRPGGKLRNVEGFAYASSSSVKRITSIYGATKHACEDLAQAYASIHGLPCTGLRYHTVYGPWGRPDMALWKLTRAAVEGSPFDLFNAGAMCRDFTFVEDVVRATLAAHDRPATRGEALALDVGRGQERHLLDLVGLVETLVGRKISMNVLPMQAGDVVSTLAETGLARQRLGFEARWDIEQGVPEFVSWYLRYREAGGVL